MRELLALSIQQNLPIHHKSILIFIVCLLITGCGPSGPTADYKITPSPTQSVPSVTDTLNPTVTSISTTTSISPTATSVPATSIPTLPAQPTTASLSGPLLAVIEQGSSPTASLLIWSPLNGSVRRLESLGGVPINVDWFSMGCKLSVTSQTQSGTDIVFTDLQGSVIARALSYPNDGAPSHPDGYLSEWTPSPSGERIAYLVHSGEQFFSGSQFQNLSVANTGDKHTYDLDTNGGVFAFAWSPVNDELAYGDYDASGVQQLIVSSFDGSDRRQLSNFSEKGLASADGQPGNFVGQLQWSPNGNLIAFSSSIIKPDGLIEGSVWVMSVDGNSKVRIAPENMHHASLVAWSQDGNTLVLSVRRRLDGGSGDDAIYWINTQTGETLRIVHSSEVPEGYISGVISIDGIDRSIILTSFADNSYMYTYSSATWVVLPKPLEDLENIIRIKASPPTFSGEDSCK